MIHPSSGFPAERMTPLSTPVDHPDVGRVTRSSGAHSGLSRPGGNGHDPSPASASLNAAGSRSTVATWLGPDGRKRARRPVRARVPAVLTTRATVGYSKLGPRPLRPRRISRVINEEGYSQREYAHSGRAVVGKGQSGLALEGREILLPELGDAAHARGGGPAGAEALGF